jgi:hypothetical protein
VNWRQLRHILESKFKKKFTSADLHNALQQRKIKQDESVHEYLLVVKEIPKGKIEVEALIQYVIDGIVDSQSNKTVLYGANNLADFKCLFTMDISLT